jgi:hypothetical protein
MQSILYAIVQVVDDGNSYIIGNNNKLYTSLEEANKKYLEICVLWYMTAAKEAVDDNKIKKWMKEPPMLMQLNPTVLSPKANVNFDVYFDQIKQAFLQFSDKSEKIKTDTDTFTTQAEYAYKNAIETILRLDVLDL